MLPTERLDFSAIAHRPKLTLPDGARLVVWVIVNVEEWDPTQPMPRTVLTPPAGGAPMPDIPNWAWHEYGNRVGFWRMLEAIDEHRIRAVLAVNGSAIARYEPIARAALERGWEFIGHGFTQKNMQKVADERDDIRKTAAAIRDFTGKNPRGWLGPGLTETWETPGSVGRRGLRICLRLGARRPACPAQDPHQADRRHPLHAGMQRRRDDADPAPQGRGILRPSDRPVRAALPRRGTLGPQSWRWWCTPTSWARRTASNTSAPPSPTSAPITTCCSGPARRSSTGTGAARSRLSMLNLLHNCRCAANVSGPMAAE